MSFLSYLKKIFRHPKIFFFVLSLLTGLLLLGRFHNIQLTLVQGDHGRDLYGFEKTLEGQTPYQDYWWVYGPLMPYYYAFIFKILGVHLHAAILGDLFLRLLTGLFVYGALLRFSSPAFAYLGAVWLWMFHPGFAHTFNHTGAVFCHAALLYQLFSYIKNPRTLPLFLSSLFVLALCFIKINIGLFSWIALVICLLLCDKILKRRTPQWPLFCLGLLLPTIVVAGHWLLLKDLPEYVIRQCFPILPSDHPHDVSFGTALKFFIESKIIFIRLSWGNFIFACLLVLLFVRSVAHWQRPGPEDHLQKKETLLATLSCLIFSGLLLHEYFSTTVPYTLFWITLFEILLSFLIISVGMYRFSPFIKTLLFVTLGFNILMSAINHYQMICILQHPDQELSLPRTEGVKLRSPGIWVTTVRMTTQFLETQLTAGDTFFALPYEPLYYFLLDKDSPTRQLIFFDHINIPEEQEKQIIADLEKRRVRFVLLSSRAFTADAEFGVFGETFCPLLAKYIAENFAPLAEFGNWKHKAGWGWPHGTRILKRIHE